MTESPCKCGHEHHRHNKPVSDGKGSLYWGCVAPGCNCNRFEDTLSATGISYRTRPCPICGPDSWLTNMRELLFEYTLNSGAIQRIWSCSCGMHYADSNAPLVDYENDSIYAAPAAVGSGISAHDKYRLAQVAVNLRRMGVNTKSKILDMGCGQGGLLDALSEMGYKDLTGFDISDQCRKVVASKGHTVTLDGSSHVFDLIILNHVLEHVRNPRILVRQMVQQLAWGGAMYIEVPDALRYHTPMLDFNSEHINHFDACSLKKLLESAGLFGGIVQEKTFGLPSGQIYGAIWIMARRSRTAVNMANFVEISTAALGRAQKKLDDQIGESPVILWGAGEYLAHTLPLIDRRQIVGIVDSSLHGKTVQGWRVEPPDTLIGKPPYPIIITAIVAARAIKEQIERMGLTNKVIELEIQ